MNIKKIKFVTPITSGRTYKLVPNYSHTLILNDNEEINISSNIGNRISQEDSVAVRVRHGYILLLVADGMGGKVSGHEASYVTAKKIQRWFHSLSKEKLELLDEKYIRTQLIREINEMKDSVFPKFGGTTLNMSIIGPEKTYIINIGDSRTYSIKDKEITIRTEDDSYLFKKLKPQTKEERDRLRYYMWKNIITNCIEMQSLTKINITTIDNNEYDVLCHITDGVSDVLCEDNIKEYILSEKPAELLVNKTITRKPEFLGFKNADMLEYLEPNDNATAIVYTKKRKKNN